MIRSGGCRVVDVRVGRRPVERVLCSGLVVWERAKYLYLGSEYVWLPPEQSAGDMQVWSNTLWSVELEDLAGTPYLYVDRSEAGVPHEGGTIQVHVLSNTLWRASVGDDGEEEPQELRVTPQTALLGPEAGAENEVLVTCPGEWEVRAPA